MAGNPLGEWRSEAARVRTLAENDVPLAYKEAQRLQASLPFDATPVDRAQVLNLLSRIEIYLAQTEAAAQHAQLALDLASQNGDPVGQAEAQLNVALNAINQAKIRMSIAATTRSMDLLAGVNRPDLLGEALLRMSMMYRRLGDWDSSITMAMQSLEIAKRSRDPIALTYAHQAMAISFEQSGNFKQAREHLAQMREQARAAHSTLLEGHSIRGLAGVLTALGDAVGGEALMREAVAMYRPLQVPFYLNHVLFGLAELLQKQGRHAEALAIQGEIISIYEKYPNKIGLWWSLSARSKYHQSMGKRSAARTDAERAYALAKDIDYSFYQSESAKQMAALAAAAGDQGKAYQFSVEASNQADKAARERTSTRMVELAQRYETESKQREIDELTRRNELQNAELRQRELQSRLLWTALFGAAIFFLGTAYFLLRLRRSHRLLGELNTQVQRSKIQLLATLDAIPDPLFVLGLDGRYYDFHTPRTDLLAAPAEILIGKTVHDVLPPKAAEICMEALQEAYETGASTGKQFELSLSHGTYWFELSVSRKPTYSGPKSRFVVLARDITERRRMEHALREREQRYRGVFDNISDPLYLLEVTPEGRFRNLEVNPAFVKSAGIPSVELIGKFVEEMVPLETAQILLAKYTQCVETGEVIDEETILRLHRGSRHYHSTLIPVRGDDMSVQRIVGICRDITERKRMEHSIEESRHLLRQLAARNEVAREDERKSLTREIHDEMGQYLLALRMGVSVVDLQFGADNPALQEKTQRLVVMVDSIIKVVRNVVTSLRPAALDMGIMLALEWLVGEYSEKTGLQCELHVSDTDIHLDDKCATALFRIVQESLTNIVKHAQADKVMVTLKRKDGRYLLEVQDNGRGFDPSVRKAKSFGLLSIRERALMLGGDLDISSAPGRATAIKVHFPIPEVLNESA